MRQIKIYTVDAFTDVPFRGNTCAACVLPDWPDDVVLQRIATQNMFSETAFIVERTAGPELRWFSISQEVDFCGHGTLSAGYVYLTHVMPDLAEVTFTTRRYGLLPVKKDGALFQITVPVKLPTDSIFDEAVFAALGGPKPIEMVNSVRGDLLVVYASEADVGAVAPRFETLMACGYYGYVLTAPGENADYVYRYFSPRMPGVWEDPVNGASQSVLAPFWAGKLGKQNLHGQAASRRGGDIYCTYTSGETVTIGGKVTLYFKGELAI